MKEKVFQCLWIMYVTRSFELKLSLFSVAEETSQK